jgi:hypothetical protein
LQYIYEINKRADDSFKANQCKDHILLLNLCRKTFDSEETKCLDKS